MLFAKFKSIESVPRPFCMCFTYCLIENSWSQYAYASIYIGNGFKLLGMSGDGRDKDNFQDHPQTPIVKKSWFSALFQSDRGKYLME